jgi:hypothetical protein
MTAPATTFSMAVERQQYELAALRLLLGVVVALEDSAPETREELITLLTLDDITRSGQHGRSGRGRR